MDISQCNLLKYSHVGLHLCNVLNIFTQTRSNQHKYQIYLEWIITYVDSVYEPACINVYLLSILQAKMIKNRFIFLTGVSSVTDFFPQRKYTFCMRYSNENGQKRDFSS